MSEVMGEHGMITIFHMDNARVLMTHYCGAGNQPRMQASGSPDGSDHIHFRGCYQSLQS